MKRIFIILVASLASSLILSSCGGAEENGAETVAFEDSELLPDDGKTYKLDDAIAAGFIQMSADGRGTFQKIKINLKNTSDGRIKIDIPAGLYFINPDGTAQSLMTAYKKGKMVLDAKENTEFEIASYCTNVKLKIPGKLNDWEFNPKYKGGLDEVVAFYGKNEKLVNKWLEKKNPIFSEETNRLAFFQTVIWLFEGGNYTQILGMLSRDVFKNDIAIATSFLDKIITDAQEIATLIKERDKAKIKAWVKKAAEENLPSREEVKDRIKKGKDRLDRIRNRF